MKKQSNTPKPLTRAERLAILKKEAQKTAFNSPIFEVVVTQGDYWYKGLEGVLFRVQSNAIGEIRTVDYVLPCAWGLINRNHCEII